MIMTKNIHLLPTEKPSRLHFNEFEELVFTPKYEKLDGVNIYITNDEKIKDGDFVYNTKFNNVRKYFLKLNGITSLQEEDKKIILTTDPDLIKDGVQAIDDEFLEWFVKNPSFEKVGVVNEQYTQNYHKDIWYNRHKIIIPKLTKEFQEVVDFNDEIYTKDDYWNEELPKVNGSYGCTIQTNKEETIEEAANEDFRKNVSKPYCCEISQNDVENSFIRGAKWNQEKSYTEEEVLKLLEDRSFDCCGATKMSYISTKEWFEQFKKK